MIAALLPIIGSIIEKVIPDPQAAADAKLKALDLAQRGELAQLEADTKMALAQIDVNKTEAQHANIFVSGWRPAIGWIGAASMAYQFILYPLLIWAWSLMQANGWVPANLQPPPMLDTDALWVILSGMLGIAGMRSVEKVKGVAK